MNELLGSLKSDLLDRRLRPVLALVAVALIAAVAYAMLGGGSSTPATTAASPPAAPGPTAIAVVPTKVETGQPVAETVEGASQQTGGSARDPFSAVPGVAKAKLVSAGAGAGAKSKSPASGAGQSSGGKAATPQAPSSSEPAKPIEEKKAKKPAEAKTVYRVNALFGTAAPGTPPAAAQLTPFEDLKRQQPLPSATAPLVVFRGVTAGGKSATFTLVGEAILRGAGVCQPNASQCQAIDLKPGTSEELEYVPPEGTPVVYELQVASIVTSKASAAAARKLFVSESKVGLQFLRAAGLAELPGMRYSTGAGVLVFAGHPAFAARARVAAWASSLRG